MYRRCEQTPMHYELHLNIYSIRLWSIIRNNQYAAIFHGTNSQLYIQTCLLCRTSFTFNFLFRLKIYF